MNDNHFLDLDLVVSDSDNVQLETPDRRSFGKAGLGPELFEKLAAAEKNPECYGETLFHALLPAGEELETSYRLAVDRARQAQKRLRLRLTLALTVPEQVHRLRWERIFDPGERVSLARSPEFAFSHYVPGHDLSAPVIGRPRLLVAVASPTDVEQHRMAKLDRSSIERELGGALQPLDGLLEWEFLEPPITVDRLFSKLQEGNFHALHLMAHGYINEVIPAGVLVLEKRNRTCNFVTEQHLSEIFLGDRNLRLVTLMTCEGAVQSFESPLSGLGRRLVARGVPAVIAMADTVRFTTARELSRFFYGGLARRGIVDSAVNEARHQLFLTDPESHSWCDPVLFMGLREGALWRSTPDGGIGEAGEPINRQTATRVVTESAGTDELAEVTRTGKKQEVRMRSALERSPLEETKQALLVGLGRYQAHPHLVCSENDARAVARMLATNEDGTSNFERTILTEEPGQTLTTSDLVEECGNILRKARDEVAIFFSGYGVFEGGSSGILLVGDEEDTPGLFVDELVAIAEASAASYVTFIIDCCTPRASESISDLLRARPTRGVPEGVTILGANRTVNGRSEGTELSHFTKAFLTALEGGAADLQGRITAAAAYAYAEQFVSEDDHQLKFQCNTTRFPTLRRSVPALSQDLLRKLREIFPEPTSTYRLSPSFEFSRIEAVPENVGIFNALKKLRNSGLLATEEKKDLYFVAIESRQVWLTESGRLYWRLAG